jgi:formylmethanofuran dehydrogenase subunit B
MIGEYLGSVVDTTIGNGSIVMGTQEAGKVGVTEGQKKNRGDLIVYWATTLWNPCPGRCQGMESSPVDTGPNVGVLTGQSSLWTQEKL